MKEWFPIPYVLPSPKVQIEWGWQEEQREEELPKLYQDHIASVEEFKAWKLEHPNDGTMTALYTWRRPIMVAGSIGVSVVSLNPIPFIMTLASIAEENRNIQRKRRVS